MIDYKLTLLARAKKDGKMVHPGLWKPCHACGGTGNMIGQKGYFVSGLTADP